ncbi:hypothetical protein MASR2M79_03510 [Aminivibrio sp.]
MDRLIVSLIIINIAIYSYSNAFFLAPYLAVRGIPPPRRAFWWGPSMPPPPPSVPSEGGSPSMRVSGGA